jgi:hypothetical protein
MRTIHSTYITTTISRPLLNTCSDDSNDIKDDTINQH